MLPLLPLLTGWPARLVLLSTRANNTTIHHIHTFDTYVGLLFFMFVHMLYYAIRLLQIDRVRCVFVCVWGRIQANALACGISVRLVCVSRMYVHILMWHLKINHYYN